MDFSNVWWSTQDDTPVPPIPPEDLIAESLSFHGQQYLINTGLGRPAGDFTLSFWMKTTTTQTDGGGIYCANTGTNDGYSLSQNAGSPVRVLRRRTSGGFATMSDGSLRDPSAWYHIVIQNQSNTTITFINGQRQSLTPLTFPASGTTIIGAANSNVPDEPFRGYLAQFFCIDGQVLAPETFARTSATGVWVPVKPKLETADYGAAGYHLDFSDPNDLGHDSSGNGNDFTATGFETVDTSSPDYDLMQDSPTQNYATINPLYPGASTSKANLTTANATGKPTILGIAGDVGVDGASVAWDGTEAGWTSTGAINFGQQPGGFDEFSTRTMPAATIANGRDHFQAITGPGQGAGSGVAGQLAGNWSADLTVLDGGTWSAGPANAFDGSEGTQANTGVTGRIQFAPTTPITVNTSLEVLIEGNMGVDWNGNAHPSSPSGPVTWQTIPGTGVIDTSTPIILTPNGFPGGSSFSSLNAVRVDGQILVDANILALAQQTFPQGLWWIKDRVNNNPHQLVDNVNGTGDVMQTNPPSVGNAYTAPGSSSIAWCWNASPEGGFSITNGTHGLGKMPAMVVDRANNFWHRSLPAGKGLVLGGTNGMSDQSWTVNETTVTGPGGGTYFTWAEIPGFSAFGTYAGNSSITDGPFIYTGFRPAFLLIQRFDSNSGAQWVMVDSVIYPFNGIQTPWFGAWRGDGEINSNEADMDIYSNGFKLLTNASEGNSSGAQYLYAAFAENPFGGRNVSPANAR